MDMRCVLFLLLAASLGSALGKKSPKDSEEVATTTKKSSSSAEEPASEDSSSSSPSYSDEDATTSAQSVSSAEDSPSKDSSSSSPSYSDEDATTSAQSVSSAEDSPSEDSSSSSPSYSDEDATTSAQNVSSAEDSPSEDSSSSSPSYSDEDATTSAQNVSSAEDSPSEDSGKHSASDPDEDVSSVARLVDAADDQDALGSSSVADTKGLLDGSSTELAPLYEHELRFPDRYIVKLKDLAAYPRIEGILGERVLQPLQEKFYSFVAKLDTELLQKLRKDEDIAFLEDDELINVTAVASWGLDRIDQRELPFDDVYNPISNGSGVDVYVMDSGINKEHDDFGGRAEYGIDVFEESGNDCHGHGTHCAGTVGGIKYGVAKGATIISVRVLDCNGVGYLSGLMKGVDWVIDYRSTSRPAVASLSLGARASPTLDNLVNKMASDGVTVVTSAGNKNADACNYSPARAASVITVGATDNKDIRAYFSNFGKCVDIFAPGTAIPSAGIGSADSKKSKSGTSMSAPHVAGAIAILLGLNPNLTPEAVKKELLDRATRDVVYDAGVNSTNALLFVGEFIRTTVPTTLVASTDPATLPPTKPATILTTSGATISTPSSERVIDHITCKQLAPCKTLKVLHGSISRYNVTVTDTEVGDLQIMGDLQMNNDEVLPTPGETGN